MVSAHSLDSRMVSMFWDQPTQTMLDARIDVIPWTPPQASLTVSDELGIIIKVIPTDGTSTGVGGYVDFFIPPGTTVLDAAYLLPDFSLGGYIGPPGCR